MAKNKTEQTASSAIDFINAVADETKRNDSFRLVELCREMTGSEPKMWGPSIIGFGSYHYKYASGHEGEAPLAGFSPRKDAIVIYLYPDFKEKEELLAKLGKHKATKGCVYLKKLEYIDIDVLKEMIQISMDIVKEMYPTEK